MEEITQLEKNRLPALNVFWPQSVQQFNWLQTGRADPESHARVREWMREHAPRLQEEYQQARAERERDKD